jgi:hypothetical protein
MSTPDNINPSSQPVFLNSDLRFIYGKPQEGKSFGRLFVYYQNPQDKDNLEIIQKDSLGGGIAAVSTKQATIWQKIGKFFGFWKEQDIPFTLGNGGTKNYSFLLNTGSLTKRVGDLAKRCFIQAINEKSQLDPQKLESDFKNKDITNLADSAKKEMIWLINSKPQSWRELLFEYDKNKSVSENLTAMHQITKNVEALKKFGEKNECKLSTEFETELKKQLTEKLSEILPKLGYLDSSDLNSSIKDFIIDNLPLDVLIKTEPKANILHKISFGTYNSNRNSVVFDIAAGIIGKNISAFLSLEGNGHLLPALKKALLVPGTYPSQSGISRGQNAPKLTKEASDWVRATQSLNKQQIESLLQVFGKNFKEYPEELRELLVKSPLEIQKPEVFVPMQALRIGTLFMERYRQEKEAEIDNALREIRSHQDKDQIIEEVLNYLTNEEPTQLHSTAMLDKLAASDMTEEVKKILKQGNNFTKFIGDHHYVHKKSPIYDIIIELYQDLDFLANNAGSFNKSFCIGIYRGSIIEAAKLALERITATTNPDQLNIEQKGKIYEVVKNIPEVFAGELNENMLGLLKSMLKLDLDSKKDSMLAKALSTLPSTSNVSQNLKIASGNIEDLDYFLNIIEHFPDIDLEVTEHLVAEFKQRLKNIFWKFTDKTFSYFEKHSEFQKVLGEFINNYPEYIYRMDTKSDVLPRMLFDALSALSKENRATYFSNLTKEDPKNKMPNLIDRSLALFFKNLPKNGDSELTIPDGIISALGYIHRRLTPASWLPNSSTIDETELNKLAPPGKKLDYDTPEWRSNHELFAKIMEKLKEDPPLIDETNKARYEFIIKRYLLLE